MARLEVLKELAKGVNRNKIKNIDIIETKNESNTIIQKFYKSLVNDKFHTDEEFANLFYQKAEDRKAYYKLKDRLFERLINTVFFIDTNINSKFPLEKEYYKIHRNAVIIKIMLGKIMRVAAIHLAEKTFKKAIFYGITDVSIEMARHLKVNYGSLMPNEKKYVYYSKVVKSQLKVYKSEIKIEDYLHSFYLKHQGLTTLKLEDKEHFKRHKAYILKTIKKKTSYKILIYGSLYVLYYYQLTGKWKKLLDTCNKTLARLDRFPQLKSKTLIITIYVQKLISLFILRDFLSFKICLVECEEYLELMNDWYFLQDLKFKAKLHQKEFQKAEQIFNQFLSKEGLKFYERIWEEKWKINEAFIHYLHRIGKLELGEVKTFRLGKFLNEVPNYSKDKKGSNVTILILQILFLLEDGKYDALIDRAEALKIYTHRYLKDDGTYRSNCFIKMLLCLPAASFDRDQVERKAKKYLEKLQAMPIEKAKQSVELEVMPYEMLWEFVMESLDRNAQKTGPGSRR